MGNIYWRCCLNATSLSPPKTVNTNKSDSNRVVSDACRCDLRATIKINFMLHTAKPTDTSAYLLLLMVAASISGDVDGGGG
jgi:hypothetical protein